jgi:hypothetical protein
MQIDLVYATAETCCEGLGEAAVRGDGITRAAAVGLLLIESPGEGGGRSERASRAGDDESRQKRAPGFVA